MKVLEGYSAEYFRSKDSKGREISLDQYRGKYLLLSFYRYASCPFSQNRINEIIKREDELSSNDIELIGIFQSPIVSINEYLGDKNIDFPIIADPGKKIFEKYKIKESILGFVKVYFKPKNFITLIKEWFTIDKMEGNKTTVPAEFLIDRNGKIIKAFYGKNIEDNLDLDYVLKTVKSIENPSEDEEENIKQES